MAAHVIAGLGWQSEIYERPPWPPEDKIVAAELGPYVRELRVRRNLRARRRQGHLRANSADELSVVEALAGGANRFR